MKILNIQINEFPSMEDVERDITSLSGKYKVYATILLTEKSAVKALRETGGKLRVFWVDEWEGIFILYEVLFD